MWIFIKGGGYYSVCQQEGDADICVRARDEADLAHLRTTYCPELGPTIITRKADYRYRALVSHLHWSEAMARIAMAIDYPRYKDTCPEERYRVYVNCWWHLCDLQEGGPWT